PTPHTVAAAVNRGAAAEPKKDPSAPAAASQGTRVRPSPSGARTLQRETPGGVQPTRAAVPQRMCYDTAAHILSGRRCLMRSATPVRLCRSAIATLSVSLFTTFTTSCNSPQNPMEPGRPELAVVTAIGLTDLGTLGGSHSEALAINGRGQVAGFSTTATGERHAFFWDGGAMRDLGAFAGDCCAASGTPFIALNDAGQVAFTSTVASGERHAVLWDGTTVRDLGTLGGDYSEATAINATGQVVGSSRIVAGGFAFHAVVWDRGVPRDLGPGRALAINGRGQVPGFSASHAYVSKGPT